MNNDAFEKKLRELTGALQRSDPTPAWKVDILAYARRESDAAAEKSTRPPRWFMAGMGVAWAAILVLNLVTPREPQPRTTQDFAAAKPILAPDAIFHGDEWALLALHQRMSRNLESLR